MNIYWAIYSALKGNNDKKERAKKVISDCERMGIEILTPDQYPLTLQNSHFIPPVLFAEGNVAGLKDQLFVSIIGTRTPSEYGIRVTKALGAALRKDRITVVSGLAAGVDGIAHEASLCATDAYMPTLAVLPCGHDTTYPSRHRDLRQRIVANNGTILSLYPPYTTLKKYHFLERNQLVAGISLITVLIEGGERSGSLSTASAALKASRELYVLPGRIDDPLSIAPLKLLNMGAKPLLTYDAIRDDLNENGLLKMFIGSPQQPQLSIPEDWRNLLLLLSEHQYIHRDLISRELSLSSSAVDSLLLDMEMEDLVETNAQGVRRKISI